MRYIKNITTVFIWAAIVTGIAQEKGTSEINFGYGTPTNNEFENALESVLTPIITLGTVSYEDTKYSGAFHAQYKYAIVDNLLLGVSGAYEKAEHKERFGNDIVERKSKIYSVAVESNYSWIVKSRFRIYSGAGLGYRMVNIKSNPTGTSRNNERTHGLAYHFNAIGIRAGGVIGVFAEVGYGYRGLVNAGLSIQF